MGNLKKDITIPQVVGDEVLNSASSCLNKKSKRKIVRQKWKNCEKYQIKWGKNYHNDRTRSSSGLLIIPL